MSGQRRTLGAAGPWFAALAFGAALIGWSTPPLAEARQDEAGPASEHLPEATLRWIARSPEQYLDRILSELRRIRPDGTVSFADIRRDKERKRAVERAKYMAKLLAYDLDGDGDITRAEYDTTLAVAGKPNAGGYDRFADAADLDEDGVISAGELYAHAGRIVDKPRMHGPRLHDSYALTQFDANGDEVITVQEATDLVNAAAAKLARLNPVGPIGDASATCAVPDAPADAEVVLLSGYEGPGLSTVAVNGMDVVTGVASVIIEEGERPLYILAGAWEHTIWKVSGAVGRIARFVVQPAAASLGPGAGVVGLPAEVVSFVTPNACIDKYFDKPTNAIAGRAATKLGQRLGRDSGEFAVIGHYYLDDVRVPSGTVRKRNKNSYLGITFVPPKKDPDLSDDEVKTMRAPTTADRGGATSGGLLPNSRTVAETSVVPGTSAEPRDRHAREIAELRKALLKPRAAGIVEIAPDEVVAPGPVESYDVRPMHAGVIQLLESGALRKTSEDTYVVLEPIPRLPANWTVHTSPHRKFVFGKGVPMPRGLSNRAPVVTGR